MVAAFDWRDFFVNYFIKWFLRLHGLFIYLLLYVAFNSQGHIATGSFQGEETSA